MSVFAGTLSDSLAYRLADVRFGSLAEVPPMANHVRLLSQTGHDVQPSPSASALFSSHNGVGDPPSSP
jgi:hypothetical protein